jgi:protein subunit release factor A
MGTLVEGYKSAIDKCRIQLKEMAVFNTNLAHVNNLLVNEELALTQDDKIKIINEFKKVNSITESQNRYKALISEMKEGKKTISESIERKAAASIQPSSKQKLDE